MQKFQVTVALFLSLAATSAWATSAPSSDTGAAVAPFDVNAAMSASPSSQGGTSTSDADALRNAQAKMHQRAAKLDSLTEAQWSTFQQKHPGKLATMTLEEARAHVHKRMAMLDQMTPQQYNAMVQHRGQDKGSPF